MELIISRVGGDVAEYHRVNRFTTMVLGDGTDNSYDIPVDDLLVDMHADSKVFDMEWHRACTREIREQFLEECFEHPVSAYGFGNTRKCPYEYYVALYEDELKDIYDLAATIIQRHARGVLARNTHGVFNPHCEIGRAFIRKMFETT